MQATTCTYDFAADNNVLDQVQLIETVQMTNNLRYIDS